MKPHVKIDDGMYTVKIIRNDGDELTIEEAFNYIVKLAADVRRNIHQMQHDCCDE